jgi:MFS family permease
MNGSLYTWSNLNQYFVSYLKYNGNPDLVPEDTSFLMPCIFLVQYCFMTIGVKLGNKVGPRISTLIGIVTMYISYFIMIFFTNYYLILVAMGVFGLGDGLANLSVIKNCWKYFPDNAALVNGIIIGGLGISSAVLTPIADYFIINPDRKEPDDDGIYSEDIANNLLNFLYFLLLLFLVLGFFAVAFTFKFETEQDSASYVFGKAGEMEKEMNNEENDTEKKGGELRVLCNGFWSWTNLTLSLFCFCGPCK